MKNSGRFCSQGGNKTWTVNNLTSQQWYVRLFFDSCVETTSLHKHRGKGSYCRHWLSLTTTTWSWVILNDHSYIPKTIASLFRSPNASNNVTAVSYKKFLEISRRTSRRGNFPSKLHKFAGYYFLHRSKYLAPPIDVDRQKIQRSNFTLCLSQMLWGPACAQDVKLFPRFGGLKCSKILSELRR